MQFRTELLGLPETILSVAPIFLRTLWRSSLKGRRLLPPRPLRRLHLLIRLLSLHLLPSRSPGLSDKWISVLWTPSVHRHLSTQTPLPNKTALTVMDGWMQSSPLPFLLPVRHAADPVSQLTNHAILPVEVLLPPPCLHVFTLFIQPGRAPAKPSTGLVGMEEVVPQNCWSTTS